MSAAPSGIAPVDHELYRSLVLDHARKPHNFGPLPTATHVAEGINPLCGDKLSIYLEIGDDGRIREARFEGTGCAISLASASMLTDSVTGLSRQDADALYARFVEMLEAPEPKVIGDVEILEELRALAGVRQFPSRIKCATLAWQALGTAIKPDTETRSRTVSTE